MELIAVLDLDHSLVNVLTGKVIIKAYIRLSLAENYIN